MDGITEMLNETEELIVDIIKEAKQYRTISIELYAFMDWWWNAPRDGSVDEIGAYEDMLEGFAFLKESRSDDIVVTPML